MSSKKKEEDFGSEVERRVRDLLTVAKPTEGTMLGGLKKAFGNAASAAGTLLETPVKVVGGAVDSAIRGGSGAKGVIQKQANELNKSVAAAGRGVDETVGNLKDDLSARAKGAVTGGVGVARAVKGAAELAGNIVQAPNEVLGDTIRSAVMGGEGAGASIERIGERMGGNVDEIRRGAAGYGEGSRQMLVGEENPRKSSDPAQDYGGAGPSGMGEARKSIDPKPDYSGAGPVPTDAKAEPANPDRMAALFKVANGGDFDPKSRDDRAKMAQLQSIANDPKLSGASDTKIAMQWYKTLK